MGCASSNVLVGHIVSEASQEVDGPIVKSRQTICRSWQLEIRDIRQLIMPPRRVNRSVGRQSLVEGMVQVLQGRSDNPRSTGGTGRNLELSCLEVLGDGGGNGGLRSLSRVDEVGRGSREAESIYGSWSGEVVHLIVQDDAVGSHDP